MNTYAWAAGLVVLSYFIGSIPTGFLFARARGIDIRERGSGNIGATNVARILGKKLGLLILILDALKGAVPVAAVYGLGLHRSVDPFVLTACGVAAICGHCFPVWLGFRGGKGVATSFGVFLVADPMVTGIVVAMFAVIYAAFRIVSLGSLMAAIALPTLLWVLQRSDAAVTLGIAGTLIIVVKHRANIVRLVRRQESGI